MGVKQMTENRSSPQGARVYVGIDQDRYGGMTPIGGIIKDAWVFELIPETETCSGWRLADIQMLHDRVAKEWDRYGLLISHLPEPLKARHQRIHAHAIERARELGWEPGLDIDSAMAHGDEPVLPR